MLMLIDWKYLEKQNVNTYQVVSKTTTTRPAHPTFPKLHKPSALASCDEYKQ